MTSLQKNLQFRFNAQVQQILSEADALTMKRIAKDSKSSAQVQELLRKGFPGLWTDQHPHCAHPDKPKCATHICATVQDSIASYEPVQEIVDSMLEKGVIRPCNSTYSAPIWPVLKPNGKWPWSAADTALCISTIIGYVVTLILAFLLHKRVNAVQGVFQQMHVRRSAHFPT